MSLIGADGRLRQTLLFMGCKPWHVSEIMDQLRESEAVLKRFNYWSSERQLLEYQLAQRFVSRRDLPVCILIGGTSGCGKSTLASLLASRIGVNTVVSTDHIRQLLRTQLDREQAPFLWSSSYNATSSYPDESAANAYDGYEQQTAYIKPHVFALCRSFSDRRESLIVEGVHLSVEVMLSIMNQHPHCIPFLLHISNQSKHIERLAIRAKYMTLEPRKNRYVKHFRNIRVIQDKLCTKADEFLIPKIDNTNIDRSLALIHRTIFEYLYRSTYTENQGNPAQILHQIHHQVRENFWSSKEMLQHIRERQQIKRQLQKQQQQQPLPLLLQKRHISSQDKFYHYSFDAAAFESLSSPSPYDESELLKTEAEQSEEYSAFMESSGAVDEHERVLMCLENLNWGSLGS